MTEIRRPRFAALGLLLAAFAAGAIFASLILLTSYLAP